MQELNSKNFFSLELFSHRDIFSEEAHVWEPLKNLESYLKSQPLGKIQSTIPSGVYLLNPHLISIGENCLIEPGAFIQGPCLIGDRCQIRHGAYIRGNVLTGNDCVIGHATEVKNSIFLERAKAAHFNYVGDSILGNDVNLGAGVKLANFRLDQKEIVVAFQGEEIPTGLIKLGAVCGDETQIGCNSVLNPGTFLYPKSLILPCKVVAGFLNPRKKVHL